LVGILALVQVIIFGEISETGVLKWYRYFTILAALTGAYFFAVVAVKGRLPTWIVRSTKSS
jgi:hypothetical protein